MALHLLAAFICLILQAECAILGLQEGQGCTPLGGGRGACTLLSRCKALGDFRKVQPPICTFKGKEPVVCCPKVVSENIKVGTKVNQYCSRTSELPPCKKNSVSPSAVSKQGEKMTFHTTVFGGVNSKPKTRTYMVLIGFGPAQEKQWQCGGSLINSRFVLSAAHCSRVLTEDAKWARLGDLDISTNTDDARIQEREIIERFVHPGYKEPQVYNDIVLFKLNMEVQFTDWVAPVCLHTKITIPPGLATVTGWGRLEFAAATSDKLQEADLEVFNDTDCKTLLSSEDISTPRGIDPKLMFCAGHRDGSKDACSGDSGGPLVISNGNSQCLKTQIGITSFGRMCGLPDSPGVYTRVSNYIAWIEGIAF